MLLHLFILAAPAENYFQTLPASCRHPSLHFDAIHVKAFVPSLFHSQFSWKARVHALNIIRQLFLDRNITIEDRFVEPALMLACEAIASSV